jgi:hypothetical protein
MTKSKVPKRFAIMGLVIGFACMGMWLYIYKYNPFHFPLLQSPPIPGNYSPPALYDFLENLEFILVPGICLSGFAARAGEAGVYVVWIVAISLNFPIYYALGLIVSTILTWLKAPEGKPRTPPDSPIVVP